MHVDGGVVLVLDGKKRGRVARRLRLEVEGELAAIGQDRTVQDDRDALPLQQPAANEKGETICYCFNQVIYFTNQISPTFES